MEPQDSLALIEQRLGALERQPLVADQFEEVWTLAADPGQAQGFLDLLTERILHDLAQLAGETSGDEPLGAPAPRGGASLPLLEFTLGQLWEHQRERRLTHLAYEEPRRSGGVSPQKPRNRWHQST